MSLLLLQPSHPSSLDDEIAALTLQLEEIDYRNDTKKAKYPLNKLPDIEQAYISFASDLQTHLLFLKDVKLAHSIANAVDSDAAAIAELTQAEAQAEDDRRYALHLSNGSIPAEAPPPYNEQIRKDFVEDEIVRRLSEVLLSDNTLYSEPDDEPGPSVPYTQRQATAIQVLTQKLQCTACTETFRSGKIVVTNCKHRYCAECIKSLFMRATKDETLFPPKCCKQPIPLEMVAKHLLPSELSMFKSKSIEFSTVDRLYCSNNRCSKFIPPSNIETGTHRANCNGCHMTTCSICKHASHIGKGCPRDPALQQTRELARAMGWQACFRCGSIVQLRTGCNHMTCRCGAQFCYVCGLKWKECSCDHANADRIEERAEEVVDRDAPELPRAERQLRVRQVRAELEENHECEHPGRFQRILHGGRRGFQCEICDNRHWKYILQCRHCFLNVCEECRRHRV